MKKLLLPPAVRWIGPFAVLPLVVSALFVSPLFVADCRAADNPVFDQLIRVGATISPGEVMRLPAPTLPDRLSAEAQRQAIAPVLDRGHSWEDMTRRSVVAPFILKLSTDTEQPRGIGRRLDMWFVAYGNLARLADEGFLNRQFKSATSESDPEHAAAMRPLSSSQLASRGIMLSKGPGEPVFTSTQFSLLDRVHLNVTTRGQKVMTADSIVSASMLDPAFANDAEFPNQWRPITRDENGRRQLGAPQTYSGYGGYAKATRLAEIDEAIFVEYHVVFAEPQGWFGGTNLLRSKLPIVAQYIVRQLRRGLKTKSP